MSIIFLETLNVEWGPSVPPTWGGCYEGTHRGQRQAEVGGLVFHLDLDLMEQRLDPLLRKTLSVGNEGRRGRLKLTVQREQENDKYVPI